MTATCNTSFEALQESPGFRRLADILADIAPTKNDQLLQDLRSKEADDAATLALLYALWERASPEAQETFRLHAGQSVLLERAQRLIGEQWDFIQWLANKGKGER